MFLCPYRSPGQRDPAQRAATVGFFYGLCPFVAQPLKGCEGTAGLERAGRGICKDHFVSAHLDFSPQGTKPSSSRYLSSLQGCDVPAVIAGQLLGTLLLSHCSPPPWFGFAAQEEAFTQGRGSSALRKPSPGPLGHIVSPSHLKPEQNPSFFLSFCLFEVPALPAPWPGLRFLAPLRQLLAQHPAPAPADPKNPGHKGPEGICNPAPLSSERQTGGSGGLTATWKRLEKSHVSIAGA